MDKLRYRDVIRYAFYSYTIFFRYASRISITFI